MTISNIVIKSTSVDYQSQDFDGSKQKNAVGVRGGEGTVDYKSALLQEINAL